MSVFDNGGFIGKTANYTDTSRYVTSSNYSTPLTFVGGFTQGLAGTTSNVSVSLTTLTGGTNSSPQAGDFVIIAVELVGAATGDKTYRISGYTQIADLYANDSRESNFQVGYKFMGSTPDTTATITGGSGNAGHAIAIAVHVWRGVNTATPLDVTPTTVSILDTAFPNPPAITPVTSGAQIIVAAGAAHTRLAATFGASYLSNFITVGFDATTDATVGMGNIAWTSGPYDPDPWTFSALDGTAYSTNSVTFALRPTTITYVGGIVQGREGTGQGSKLPISLSSLGLQEGDMVIVAYESTGTVNKSLPIVGYTTVVDLYANNIRDSNLLVAYKFMGASPDAEVTIERTDSSDDGGAVAIQAYRGVDSQNPFDVTSTTATFTTSVIPNPPAITPITSGAKIVIAAGGNHSRGGGVVYQASYLSNFLSISRDAPVNDAIIGMGHIDWTSGSYDPAVFTFTGTDNTSNFTSSVVTMALKPGFSLGHRKNSGIWSLPTIWNSWRNKASIVWDTVIASGGGNNAYSGELKVGDVLFGFTSASYGLFDGDGSGNVHIPSPVSQGFTTIHANGNEGNSFYLVYKVITPENISDPKDYYSGGGQASTILYNIRGLELTQFTSASYTTLLYATQFNNTQNYLKDRSLYAILGTIDTSVNPPSITPASINSVILTFSTCCVNNFTPSLTEGYSLIRNDSSNSQIARTLTTTIKHGVSNTLQDPPSFGTISASGDGTWHVTMALKVL